MKLETKFQNRVLKDLKSLPNTWVLKTQERARRGIPDILSCVAGHFVAIELKASQEAIVSPLQRYEISNIEHSGGYAYIAFPENWDTVLKEIKQILK